PTTGISLHKFFRLPNRMPNQTHKHKGIKIHVNFSTPTSIPIPTMLELTNHFTRPIMLSHPSHLMLAKSNPPLPAPLGHFLYGSIASSGTGSLVMGPNY